MAEPRRIRPNYDEPVTIEEPLEYEDAVQRLLNAPADVPMVEDELVEEEDF